MNRRALVETSPPGSSARTASPRAIAPTRFDDPTRKSRRLGRSSAFRVTHPGQPLSQDTTSGAIAGRESIEVDDRSPTPSAQDRIHLDGRLHAVRGEQPLLPGDCRLATVLIGEQI